MNTPSMALYNAKNWAHGQSSEEIQTEINRIDKMWLMGPTFEFPGNANYQYVRMNALKGILEDRKQGISPS